VFPGLSTSNRIGLVPKPVATVTAAPPVTGTFTMAFAVVSNAKRNCLVGLSAVYLTAAAGLRPALLKATTEMV
jgi:hypothetical protein